MTNEEKAIKKYFKKRNRIILYVSVAVIVFITLIAGLFFAKKNKENKNNNTAGEVVNNNEKEDKEITGIDNKDNNKEEKEDVFSKPSSINLRLIIFIFIIILIIIGVIIFIIVKLNKFKFNEESRKDFAKENFCPTFFMIAPHKIKNLLEKKTVNDVKEDAECFFEILAKLIFLKDENYRNIDLFFYLCNTNDFISSDDKINNYNLLTTTNLKYILDKIYSFAFSIEHVEQECVDQFIHPIKNEFDIKKNKSEKQKIEQKYGKEFDSYLCAYLLYHFFEVIGNKVKVKIFYSNKNDNEESIKETFTSENKTLSVEYNINYDIISKILKKLLSDKPIENVSFN